MLNPNHRTLVTAALTPPPGTGFDGAVLLSYSLDPGFLLSLPLHLALRGGSEAAPLQDGVAVMESVRRFSSSILVFAQQGRLQVPQPPSPLFGLVEGMVHEVKAPLGGAFHAKLWLLRFRGEEQTVMRLVLPTRNLTFDRSWDLSLTLEGIVGTKPHSQNRPVADLLAQLPRLSSRSLDPRRQELLDGLREDLRRVAWNMPWGFDQLEFRVLGLKRGGWAPASSYQLAVLSPFCTKEALAALAATTRQARVLITRPETLESLGIGGAAPFGSRMILHEAAETEDGEEPERRDTLGLHAKVYVAQGRWDTQVTMGSANATTAALVAGVNVEILAELTGKKSKVGGVDQLLGPDGLAAVLIPAPESAAQPEEPDARHQAEAALETLRGRLADVPLRACCQREDDGGPWRLVVRGDLQVGRHDVVLRVWPITLPSQHAEEVRGLDSELVLGPLSAASLTGLLAFELTHPATGAQLRFVRLLVLENLPEERDAAILETVIRNRDGFVRYLLFLLGDAGDGQSTWAPSRGAGGAAWLSGTLASSGLLEELVRALGRQPERLREVARVVDVMRKNPEADRLLPPQFLETWSAFEEVLEARRG